MSDKKIFATTRHYVFPNFNTYKDFMDSITDAIDYVETELMESSFQLETLNKIKFMSSEPLLPEDPDSLEQTEEMISLRTIVVEDMIEAAIVASHISALFEEYKQYLFSIQAEIKELVPDSEEFKELESEVEYVEYILEEVRDILTDMEIEFDIYKSDGEIVYKIPPKEDLH